MDGWMDGWMNLDQNRGASPLLSKTSHWGQGTPSALNVSRRLLKLPLHLPSSRGKDSRLQDRGRLVLAALFGGDFDGEATRLQDARLRMAHQRPTESNPVGTAKFRSCAIEG